MFHLWRHGIALGSKCLAWRLSLPIIEYWLGFRARRGIRCAISSESIGWIKYWIPANGKVISTSRTLTGSVLCSASIHRSVKCHGVVLDFRLTWRNHVNINIKKAHNVLCACRGDYGATWGLEPKVVCWLPDSIIRSSITFAHLVLLPWYKTASAKIRLSRIQRFLCLWITGALCTTFTGAMMTLYCLPLLDIVVQSEARSAAHRSGI